MRNGIDTAVVFFSRDGNTRLGAKLLSDRIGGKLIELKELRPGNALHSLFRMKTPLAGDPWKEIASARRVILMCPIWAGSSVPAMNAFAHRADFTDKDVYIVTFQQAPNPRQSHREQQHLAGIVARNHGSVRDCYALVGGKMGQFAGEERIGAQIALVKMPEEAQAEPVVETPAEGPRKAPEITPWTAVAEVPDAVADEMPEEALTPPPLEEITRQTPVEAPEEAAEEAAETKPAEIPEGAVPEEIPEGTEDAREPEEAEVSEEAVPEGEAFDPKAPPAP